MKTEKISIHPFFKEKAILFPVILLCGIGIIMVYSASSTIALEKNKPAFFYMKKQTWFFMISLGIMFVASGMPYRIYKKISYIILAAAIGLLCAVLVPGLGIEILGSYRWLKLGPITFQPAEYAKLALVLFLGYSLSKKQDKIKSFSVGFVPHVLIMAVLACLIIVQPDFGTIIILGAITWAMMFIAGVKISHLLAPAPIVIPLIYFLVSHSEYRMKRIMGFLNPWADPFKDGFQITHSLKAFGSGGIFGKGLGMGIQKLHYLPEPHTDFIFSVIGEELGLVGVLSILGLYLVLLSRGMKIARTCTDSFGAITAAGLTFYMGIQVFINTGVTMGLLPTKGLTLPFISYGGTSLLINMAAMGILMNIGASKYHESAV